MAEYDHWEKRPVHPVTGVPADYYWQRGNGVREPRWRNPFLKGPSPEQTWYSVSEVCQAVGQSKWTVRDWIAKGLLKAAQPKGEHGRYFIRGDWLAEALQATPKGTFPK